MQKVKNILFTSVNILKTINFAARLYAKIYLTCNINTNDENQHLDV